MMEKNDENSISKDDKNTKDEELTPAEIENISKVIDETDENENDENKDLESSVSKAQFMQLQEDKNLSADLLDIQSMNDIKVHVEIVLGVAKRTINEILALKPNSIIELDKLAGEPVNVVANGKIIANAEIVVVDENFGVKIIAIAGLQKVF